MKTLTAGRRSDTIDSALVEMSLEICADAIAAAQSTGMESMRERLHAFQVQLIATALSDRSAQREAAARRGCGKAFLKVVGEDRYGARLSPIWM